ncbi:WD domain-containing protein [Colletotrichum scovillei]|uniref:WD domain-containing protein n=1 Tax=Colletotrichum scovillei TaxID=1209932 RepID=A0A9P7QWN1_9PEZI|nr:WD domain-containing protein [Colletotrichum scovillei]KAG7049262.1 WD domain-containing protein [Colletotrichum scovillei]KAG7064006.1 WD domain-containing protein [Colletotrichum scovillei]
MNRHHAQFVAGPLQRDHYFTPVTGLSFFNVRDGETYLLAGEDTELKVYDGEGRLRCQLGIFHAQPIHGIHVAAAAAGHGERRHVLLWGNQAVTVVSAAVIEELILGAEDGTAAAAGTDIIEAKAPDWIYDGVICPEDPDRGVLITAHNEVLEFSVGSDGKTVSFGRIVSPSRPILYSANLTWLSETSVLVAGGTVFGEIIVWKCHFSGGDGDGAATAAEGTGTSASASKPWCEVLFVFTGHEGSIFGVDISREIDLGGGCTARLLASCSDDRTIRIWDITERPGSPRLQYDAFGEARETGFGGSSSSSAPTAAATDLTTTQVASSAPLAMVMGHISRIWHVRFPLGGLDELAKGRPATVYSFGEDSTLQAWSLAVDLEAWRRRAKSAAAVVEGREAPVVAASITYKETYARHDGKHIWATAVTEKADGQVLVATGGADSKINLFSDRSLVDGSSSSNTTASKLRELPSELQTLVMRDVVSKLAPRNPDHAIPLETKEAFQRFAFVREDTIVATSTTGRLLVGSFGPELTWTQIGTDGETMRALNACTSLKSPAPGLALIGTANKKILLYRDSTVQQVGTVPGKVADIFPLRKSSAEDKGASDKKLEFLVTMLGSGDAMQILTLDLDASAVTSMVPVPELDSRFVVTAACQVNDLLVLGSRHGYVSVFRRAEGEQQLIPFPAPDRRSGDAITSINVFPTSSTASAAAASHIITTSRDGNYRVYETSDSGIHLRHETAPAAVPNLEDAWLSDSGDLILCGFRSKNFIVWNETRHEEILRVDCGGAHRAFAYTRQGQQNSNRDGDRDHGMRFVFNKAATLGVYTQHSPSVAATHHRTLKRGSHGREVRAIAYSGHSRNSGPRRYIATGSEDTSIRIWEYTTAGGASHDERRELRCVKVVKVHTAGLQSLKWLGEDLLFSCSGNEEFMVWRACDLGGRGLGLMREAVFADKSEDGDLRITSFDVVALDKEENGSVAVTMAFSNSFVKTYRYTPGQGFELLFKGQYTGACLTQARHLRVREGVFDVITAATDGCLAIWRSRRSEYVLRHTERIHQSSIKALDVHFTSDDRVVVLTGGDDNALGIVTLVSGSSSNSDSDNENDSGFETVTRAGVRKAHAAAINGLTVLGERGGRVDFVTVSNDQRVKMWWLGWREGVEEITLLADEYSGVADAGDVEIIGDGKVAVGGVGLEVWDWKS